jgi:hypothetical protein
MPPNTTANGSSRPTDGRISLEDAACGYKILMVVEPKITTRLKPCASKGFCRCINLPAAKARIIFEKVEQVDIIISVSPV